MPGNENRKTTTIRFSPKYKPLFREDLDDVRYIVITGGRGSGKSYAISTAVSCIHARADFNTLYLRQTLVSANVSIIPEFYEKMQMLGLSDQFERRNLEIVNKRTGCHLFFRGIQTSKGSNEAQLKSIKRVGLALIDEAQELVDEDAFDRIDLSLRDKGIRNRVILSLNPIQGEHWIYRRFFKERGIQDDFNGILGDTAYIHTTYEDNIKNLDADFIRLAEQCRERNPRKYHHLYEGFWGGASEDALWTEEMLDPYRVCKQPDGLERIVVAVDPAVTSGADSDETGIVVAGTKRLHGETHYYVLADRSMRATPNAWSGAVVNAFREFSADKVIAETNNGGDLVETMLRQGYGRLPFRAVHATRGKILRAEPISALYERGLVHHCGFFGKLEDQMLNFTGANGEKSPDRLDALVWALTELAGRHTSQLA